MRRRCATPENRELGDTASMPLDPTVFDAIRAARSRTIQPGQPSQLRPVLTNPRPPVLALMSPGRLIDITAGVCSGMVGDAPAFVAECAVDHPDQQIARRSPVHESPGSACRPASQGLWPPRYPARVTGWCGPACRRSGRTTGPPMPRSQTVGRRPPGSPLPVELDRRSPGRQLPATVMPTGLSVRHQRRSRRPATPTVGGSEADERHRSVMADGG